MPSNFPATAPRGRQLRPSPLTIPPRLADSARLCATGLVGAVMFLLASAVPPPAGAEPAAPDRGATTGCEQPPHAAATPPATGEHSGTRPGSEGSTGWTGGTGGSYTGLTPHAGTPASPDRQPEVVTGVNPKAEPSNRPC